MSPKLVEVGRHMNIELMTCAEVEGIAGEPGNFTVMVRQHPRYVDSKKCTGCGIAQRPARLACRMDLTAAFRPVKRSISYTRRLSQMPSLSKSRVWLPAGRLSYSSESTGLYCPDRRRALRDAYRSILEDNPFPSICGRVCNHRCETACNRAQVDTA